MNPNQVNSNWDGNMRWQAEHVVADTMEDLIGVLRRARGSRTKVRVVGSSWSWSRSIDPGPNGISVSLGNDFQKITWGADRKTIRVGAGVRLHTIQDKIGRGPEPLQFSPIGACTSDETSQTIGGLIATNVHHSGTATFFDRCEVLECVNFDDSTDGTPVQRKYRKKGGDSFMFAAFFGSVGTLGIITHATFTLDPVQHYQPQRIIKTQHIELDALMQEFLKYYQNHNGKFGELIVGAGRASALLYAVDIYREMVNTRGLPVQGKTDKNPFVATVGPWIEQQSQRLLSYTVPPVLFSVLWYPLQLVSDVISNPTDMLVRTFTRPVFSYVYACTSDRFLDCPYMDAELFVLVNDAVDLAGYLQSNMGLLQYDCFIGYRYVFRSDSAFVSPNGKGDVVAVDVDCRNLSRFREFREWMDKHLPIILKKYEGRVWLHMGKYTPESFVLDRYLESQFNDGWRWKQAKGMVDCYGTLSPEQVRSKTIHYVQ